MKAQEIRDTYLSFFAERGHRVVPSASLVPSVHDPSVLLTTAGMQPFKPYFLGREKPPASRLADVQKCFRTTDIEEVGKDARHHTFFEMLGNWSFGDYYKAESLRWGYDFLVKEMGLDPARLWYTVYKDDDEAYDIFVNDLGMPAERIVRLGDIEQGDEENFWSMGDVGSLRPLRRDPLRPGRADEVRPPRRLRGGRLRLRPLARALEPRLHAVRPRPGRQADAPADARASTPAWASSAWRQCSRTWTATTRPISSSA